MSRWCVLCGEEYAPSVLECGDCEVPVIERKPLAVDELLEPDDDHLAYDFDELEAIQRFAISERLAEAGVPHVWEDLTLLVRDEDEDRADAVIDAIDEEDFLTTEVDQLTYDLDDWDDARRARLGEALTAAGVEHAWDENGDLVVLLDDEDRVDGFVDRFEPDDDDLDDDDDDDDDEDDDDEGDGDDDGDDLDDDDDDDDGDDDGEEDDPVDDELVAAYGERDPHEVLSDLFVSADRLMKDARQPDSVVKLVQAARYARRLPLPFGFEPGVWRQILELATTARTNIEDDRSDEAIVEAARELRTFLRDWV